MLRHITRMTGYVFFTLGSLMITGVVFLTFLFATGYVLDQILAKL